MNYFAQRLYDYFAEGGRELPPYILEVLSKPLTSLNAEEIDIYNRYIGPFQTQIRKALMDIYRGDGFPHREWAARISQYYQPVVESLVSQVLGLKGAADVPLELIVRLSHGKSGTKLQRLIRGFTIQRMSSRPLKWLTITAAIIIALSLSGWLYLHFTASSRLYNKARDELAKGEYAPAMKHLEEFGKKYPGSDLAGEVDDLRADAALRYAEILVEDERFEEAVDTCKIANTRTDHRKEIEPLLTRAYFGWAGALSDSSNNAHAYECCETALAVAPPGYDTNPIKELRAEILFAWGGQLWDEGDYESAAERFEKCYTDWPAGPLANKAIQGYVDMIAAYFTEQPPPSKTMSSGGNVELRLVNQTAMTFRFFLSGPTSLYVDLAPGAHHTIYILPGVYSTGYVVDKVGGHFNAGENYSYPTLGRTWWELTMPAIEEKARPSLAYQDILDRMEKLKPALPAEIASSLSDVKYEQITDPARSADVYGEFIPSTDTIAFATRIPLAELSDTIFHEWGHAFSDFCLDDEEKAEYMQLRGLNPDTRWDNGGNYYLSVEEDFAEVFSVIFGSAEWDDYTWYGPVANPGELKAMIITAAD